MRKQDMKWLTKQLFGSTMALLALGLPGLAADPDFKAISAAILAAKPIAYWPLHESTNSLTPDSASGKHAAKLEVGASAYQAKPPAANIAGGRALADLGNLNDNYSIELWFWNDLPTSSKPVTGYLVSRGTLGAAEAPGDHLGIGGSAVASGRLFFFNGNRKNTTLAGSKLIRPKAWNHAVLTREGNQIVVYLNGMADARGEAERGYAKNVATLALGGRTDGLFGLHGRLTDVAAYDRTLTPEEVATHFKAGNLTEPQIVAETAPPAKGEWKPLFNGKDLSGFYVHLRGRKKGEDPDRIFQVHDGVIHVYRDASAGETMPFGGIVTEREFSHYRLRLQYKWGEKQFAPRATGLRDAGILYHVKGNDAMWPTSVECQIQEGDTGDIFTVFTRARIFADPNNPDRYLSPADGGVLRSIGGGGKVTRLIKHGMYEIPDEWNTVEVIVRGDKAVHILNGKVNNQCSEMQFKDAAAADGWAPLTKGHILFQCEWAEVFYRNIEIIELDPAELDGPQPELPPLAPKESQATIQLRDGFDIELMAAEPMVADPVAIEWGPDGRLWVVEMADYPLGIDGKGKSGGRIRYLEDTDGDGTYDKSTLFMTGVNFPTGIMPWRGGVVVTAAPEIFYAADTNGDGKADLRETLYRGLGEGNTQLRVNGLQPGLDGWVYCANGWSGGKVHGEKSGVNVNIAGRDFRIRLDDNQAEAQSGVSEFGRNRDDWGNWFGCDNAHPLFHFVLPDHYLRRNPHFATSDTKVQVIVPEAPTIYAISPPEKRFHSFDHATRFTSACASIIYRDNLLTGADALQHCFVCEPVHNLVHHELVSPSGSTFTASRPHEEQDSEFLASKDRWFRPVQVRTGPDGALWIVDMYRYIIEHPEWMPPEGKAAIKPFERLGDDRGRLYRVYPRG
jgi:putative membrane-bound dehydrogenase-like protein